MPSPEILGTLCLKALGSTLGAFFALVFLPPKTWREFVSRASVTAVAGVVFAPSVLYYTSWPHEAEHIVSAGALAAFASWWAMGALIKAARAWTPK